MNNHVDVILWLTRHRTEGGTESALQWAVSRGHTQVGILDLFLKSHEPLHVPGGESCVSITRISYHLLLYTQSSCLTLKYTDLLFGLGEERQWPSWQTGGPLPSIVFLQRKRIDA